MENVKMHDEAERYEQYRSASGRRLVLYDYRGEDEVSFSCEAADLEGARAERDKRLRDATATWEDLLREIADGLGLVMV